MPSLSALEQLVNQVCPALLSALMYRTPSRVIARVVIQGIECELPSAFHQRFSFLE